ncbi:DUF3274 domain-containing protein [Rugamonas sp. CCM 8940]|uniref:T6SS effector phospholipase Tle3 domain-containing protein n=1 Tax=Rugamonas sp. CCM 8940 TaxID=2765359 RepID=UPI0018F68ED2|nr:DUF3274 domain-containing protein [Rugamonas sp. CCM 8940]MBJ7314341.1 DUF3274 domain-containing protein [Rugamonas sp. CCM 8940]
MGLYKKTEYVSGSRSGITMSNRMSDTVVDRRPKMPGAVIVVHGVNDVGTSYDEVEKGLCAGLTKRLCGAFVPATYRIPKSDDRNKVLADPDDIFFKRLANDKTFSPVIPFYWGYSEMKALAKVRQGQITDRDGNRLDLDYTKGGGPFGNATTTLPDMWNRGASWRFNLSSDPTRPLFNTPPRMYMVLAARRLAALIAMIRDYGPDETVTVVGHSQGCLITLLAQAFLKEEGCRPADTLILTHPPYSLAEHPYWIVKTGETYRSGEDAQMHDHYDELTGWQNLHARLQTLVNTVHTVIRQHVTPIDMKDFLKSDTPYYGTVGARWDPAKERDNRRKVYLYFCPQDMTVALDSVQGIGWQGVPDFIEGEQLLPDERVRYFDATAGETRRIGSAPTRSKTVLRRPLQELGEGFYQRVFTDKQRINPATGNAEPVLVGAPPHDYALRIKGENDHDHVASGNRIMRDGFPAVKWPIAKNGAWPDRRSEREQRDGIRSVTGEALPTPVAADLRGQQQIDRKDGPYEAVDPIDASTAVSSGKGVNDKWVLIADPTGSEKYYDSHDSNSSPHPALFKGPVQNANGFIREVRDAMNRDKSAGQCCDVLAVYKCLGTKDRKGIYQLLVKRTETPDEARLRWQHEEVEKSFHGSIFGSSGNHEHVTAYDLAIGQGTAVSDPKFYAYLCAVADWRMKKPGRRGTERPSIALWGNFLMQFKIFLDAEPEWRKKLIEGNCDYYSTGELPACLPVLPAQLPLDVVCESLDGKRMERSTPPKGKKS